MSDIKHCTTSTTVGCVAHLAERRSLAGELTLSYARSATDGWPLCG